jgi:citrate synthase
VQFGITYIDGDKGELLYRGYPIEVGDALRFSRDLLPLLYGELPTLDQKENFVSLVSPHDGERADALLHARLRRDAHPMAVLTGLVGALSAFYRTR